MRAKELIDRYNLHATGGYSQTMFLPAVENLMEEYAKHHAELAFDACNQFHFDEVEGILNNTHSEYIEKKQEYINKTFPK